MLPWKKEWAIEGTMRIMDLRQLEYFLRVAQRRNISLAAAELNITQPSLTKSIKLLEKTLGVRLFERLARGVELTDYGHTLRRHADRGGPRLVAPPPAARRRPGRGALSRHPPAGGRRLRRGTVSLAAPRRLRFRRGRIAKAGGSSRPRGAGAGVGR